MSKLNIQLSILACTLVILITSCNSKNVMTIVPDDSYITSIKDTIIIAEGGKEYKINTSKAEKIYYLIRHAEKDTIPDNSNPILTEEGLSRANYLAEMLKGTRVDAIYSTLYTRTLFTVDTLAARKGLKILPYEVSGLKELHETISNDNSQSAVVIVGHSNTTPAFANVILGRQEFNNGFDESDYDNLLIVISDSDGNNIVHKLKYRPR